MKGKILTTIMLAVACLVLLLPASGCKNPFCSTEEEIVEIEYGIWEDVSRSIMAAKQYQHL